MSKDVVILSAVRTPIGRFQGRLAPLSAVQLGVVAAEEAVRQAGLPITVIDECIIGHVLTAGLGQNAARQVALGAGLPDFRPGHDGGQGVWLGAEIGGTCGAGIVDR